jgi:hypothetical protein
VSLPQFGPTPGDEDDIPSFIVGSTREERARIARRATFALRSCLVVVVVTLIFEGVVLGGTRFGWIGAIVGPFAIYLAGGVLGILGALGLMLLAHFADRGGDRSRERDHRPSTPHPLGDEQLDGPTR